MNSVEDFKKNPEKVLNHLYRTAKKKCVYILVQQFPGMKSQADEIFQEAMVIMWENIEKNKLKSGYLDKYLTGVMINLARERHRKSKKDRDFLQSKSLMRIFSFEGNGAFEITEERLKLISKTLNEMGDPCQKLLTMFYFDNIARDEIIKILGYKNADTLKTKKYKCLKRLQKMIRNILDRK